MMHYAIIAYEFYTHRDNKMPDNTNSCLLLLHQI